ncbi:MAG: 6-phosphofructokinase [Bacteroidia bacterium]|nr:6-phosphofructokinase [Bacteroidia bacterium]
MKRIGVFTSGGDAPGMNACVRAVVRTALYHKLEVVGIKRGYQGMIDNEFIELNSRSVANIIQMGGTVLKTARCEAFRTVEGRARAAANLKSQGIEALVCIGGNGSYTGALKLYQEHKIPTIGLPGTIDNDLFGTDFTIGYDTAINTAVDAIDKIRDTADSHNRVFLVEVMGRDAGFIGMAVGISGGAEGIFIPEDRGEMSRIIEHFKRTGRRSKAFSIIVVSEGDEEGGAKAVEKKLKEEFTDINVRTTILGHIQRGGSPTAKDRVLASQLGYNAVLALLEGYTSKAVGIQGGNVVLTDFEEAIGKSKKVNPDLIRMAEILSY